MKTRLTSAIAFFFLIIIGSCKKQDPQLPPSNTPVFYFNGTVNAAPVNIKAGVYPYYMYSSYALDANGVYDFTGELKAYGCTANCANSLKIYLKDYRKYAVAPTTIDSSIVTGFYSFATPSGTASKFSVQYYDSLYNGNAQSYLWDFGDGTTSNLDRPIHSYARPGIYAVSLNTQSMSSCSSSLTNDVMVGQVGGLVQLSFGGNAVGTTVNLATTNGGGVPPYSFHWDFGDGNTTTVATPTVSNTYSSPGVYPVTLTRTDAANTVQVCRRNFPTQTFTATCYVDFYPTFITPSTNTMNLSDVTIEWHDAGGNLYTSSNNSQPSKSMFQVISVSNYQNNSSGQPTKMIHAKVTCTLYNGTNNIVLDGDVIFSIAYL